MSWDKGFNFRNSALYVTDGTNETYVVSSADLYKTTRNGVDFGWSVVAGLAGADRSSGNDRRLAGINYNNATQTFQVDLPAAGSYTVQLALGDQGAGGDASCTATVKDSAATLATVNFAANVANQFTDATGAILTNVTWPGSEVAATLTFATTTLNLVMSSASYWTIAHLFVSQAGGSPTVTGPFRSRNLRPALFKPGQRRVA